MKTQGILEPPTLMAMHHDMSTVLSVLSGREGSICGASKDWVVRGGTAHSSSHVEQDLKKENNEQTPSTCLTQLTTREVNLNSYTIQCFCGDGETSRLHLR
jgi:hypothetical protein